MLILFSPRGFDDGNVGDAELDEANGGDDDDDDNDDDDDDEVNDGKDVPVRSAETDVNNCVVEVFVEGVIAVVHEEEDDNNDVDEDPFAIRSRSAKLERG